jgi:hypothetical protein
MSKIRGSVVNSIGSNIRINRSAVNWLHMACGGRVVLLQRGPVMLGVRP